MIESQLLCLQAVQGYPSYVTHVDDMRLAIGMGDQSKVDRGQAPAARVPFRARKTGQLRQIGRHHTGFFPQFTFGRRLRGGVVLQIDKPAGQSPLIEKRVISALGQQHTQLPAVYGKQHAVDGDKR
ncbi:hypothetical protein D3C80_1256340 [compost metagenome]